MGKVYSLIDWKNTGTLTASIIENQEDLMWNSYNARNAYKRNVLNPNSNGNNCQVIHIDFKNKKKVA
jgi:hypothetical protein